MVRCDNQLTEAFECPVGLRQGCKMSPIIFSLLINEVAQKVKVLGRGGYQFLPWTEVVKIALFADAIALLAFAPTNLQLAIIILEATAGQIGRGHPWPRG